jgi:predicted transcriptional regulator
MAARIEITEERVTRRRGIAELARRVGRDHSHVSRVLSGERKAGKDLERKLARLGVRLGKGAA